MPNKTTPRYHDAAMAQLSYDRAAMCLIDSLRSLGEMAERSDIDYMKPFIDHAFRNCLNLYVAEKEDNLLRQQTPDRH